MRGKLFAWYAMFSLALIGVLTKMTVNAMVNFEKTTVYGDWITTSSDSTICFQYEQESSDKGEKE